MKELQILTPDGRSRIVPLEGDAVSLGRSGAAQLSFPDDTGLSRHHLSFERDGDEAWTLRDLGSKNGTLLNGAAVAERTRLKPGDRIAAGHLILIYDNPNARNLNPVVTFDTVTGGAASSGSSTIESDLTGIFRPAPQPRPRNAGGNACFGADSRRQRTRRERPLPELFPFILDLAIEAVKAIRGVLLTLENGELMARANKGEGFRISTAVRDRVLNTGVSRAGPRHRPRRSAAASGAASSSRISARLMAVPLQTSEQIIGIIYVDSPSMLREFTKDDLNLLTVMANVAAIRIEQTRFAEIEQATPDHGARSRTGRRNPAAVFCLPSRPSSAASIWPATTRPAAPSAAIISISFPTEKAASPWCSATFPAKACPPRF